MKCDRCGTPILPGEAFETLGVDQPTGAGATVHVHLALCKRPPVQTAPVSPARKIRED